MEVKGVVVVEDAPNADTHWRTRRCGALEHVANRPILHHVLDSLKSGGVEEIIVAASTEVAEDVRDSLATAGRPNGCRLRFVEQSHPVDLIAALKLAAPTVGEAPCIVHLGNGLLADPLPSLLECVQGASSDVVLAVHQGSAPDKRLSSATQDLLHV